MTFKKHKNNYIFYNLICSLTYYNSYYYISWKIPLIKKERTLYKNKIKPKFRNLFLLGVLFFIPAFLELFIIGIFFIISYILFLLFGSFYMLLYDDIMSPIIPPLLFSFITSMIGIYSIIRFLLNNFIYL